MKHLLKGSVLSIALCLAVTLVAAPKLFAKDGVSGSDSNTTTTTKTTTEPVKTTSEVKSTTDASKSKTATTTKAETKTELETEAEKPKSADTTKLNPELHQEIERKKLDGTKKPLCEAHKYKINTGIVNVTDRSQNQYSRIDQIFTMTTKYYTDKGLTVSNYDALVATVTQTKAAAEASLKSLQATPKLSCDSDGTKADIQSFLNLRLDKETAFKAYRSAVKALVDAVKTAAKAAETTTTQGAN